MSPEAIAIVLLRFGENALLSPSEELEATFVRSASATTTERLSASVQSETVFTELMLASALATLNFAQHLR